MLSTGMYIDRVQCSQQVTRPLKVRAPRIDALSV